MDNYTVIVDVTSTTFVPVGTIVLGIIDLIAITVLCVCWKNMTLSSKCCLFFVIAVFSYCFGCYIYASLEMKDEVTEKYFRGEYEVVEGIIENYDATGTDDRRSGPDYYEVNGICFSTSSFTGYGYNMDQCRGGILKDGLKVRICYIPYKYENVIMKIEAVLEE